MAKQQNTKTVTGHQVTYIYHQTGEQDGETEIIEILCRDGKTDILPFISDDLYNWFLEWLEG